MKYLSLEPPEDQRIGYQQVIKERNIKCLFDLVRGGKCASRAELSRITRLSATTVSALTEELQSAGLICQSGPALTSQPGRRAIGLRLNDAGRHLAVFSLSRKGVRFTLFDLACRELERIFVDYPVGGKNTPSDKSPDDAYADVFEEILTKRSRLFDRDKAIVIGVSFPGIYLEDEQAFSVRTAMNISFSEASMRRLEARVGVPLFLANVSMCSAYAEKKLMDAASKDGSVVRDLIFINVCDGVGAGVIADGSILTGPFNTAGEFGHISIDPHGPACACGNRGCLEQYVSLYALLENARAACALAGIKGPESFAELADGFTSVPAVAELLSDAADKLAYGIYVMLCVTGIRRVVVGGGIERLGDEFLNRVASRLQGLILTRHMHMTYALSGPDADSLGIAQYFLDKAYSITMPGAL